jgi:UDP-N-acetylglucosamine 2-epimerase (non-hydrolysing)
VTSNPIDPILFIGTRAELIKTAPVISRLAQEGVKLRIVWVGLHSDSVLLKSKFENVSTFSLSAAKRDKDSILAVLVWFATRLARLFFSGMLARFSRSRSKIVIVHGDTLCTVLGSFFAKTIGAQLFHIEAGVRSGSFLRPFPEEISRRFVSRLTDVHFAPGNQEVFNLSRLQGEIVNTFHNTSRDALYRVIENFSFEDAGYIVVTLHRTELLSRKRQFSEIIEKLIELSKTYDLRWYIGSHERSSIRVLGYEERIRESEIKLYSRTSHQEFIQVVASAHCVITDSGGLQSECNDLGIPVIVHRRESEYSNPDNSPCTLTMWDLENIDHFLSRLKNNVFPRGPRLQVVSGDIIACRIVKEIKKVG